MNLLGDYNSRDFGRSYKDDTITWLLVDLSRQEHRKFRISHTYSHPYTETVKILLSPTSTKSGTWRNWERRGYQHDNFGLSCFSWLKLLVICHVLYSGGKKKKDLINMDYCLESAEPQNLSHSFAKDNVYILQRDRKEFRDYQQSLRIHSDTKYVSILTRYVY